MTRTVHARATRKHTFNLSAPWAREVYVAGSFNAWEPKARPMQRGSTGQWTATVELKPGRHEYKFVVDGRWCCEHGRDGACPDCRECVPNAFGTMNRVLAID